MQARKALKALRGLVKLQALVRGHLVRKQATATLRCMQALVTAQARARAQRIRSADDESIINHRQSTHRRNSQEKIKHAYHVSMLLLNFIQIFKWFYKNQLVFAVNCNLSLWIKKINQKFAVQIYLTTQYMCYFTGILV